jgi:hypothetical protein
LVCATTRPESNRPRPAAVNNSESLAPAARKGIYELDGNTLTSCVGPPDKTPSEFSDKRTMLIVLKRIKR